MKKVINVPSVVKKVTKKEYLKLYLRTWGLNHKYLSQKEIQCLIELLFHNAGKPSYKYTSPFQGEGRAEMIYKLGGISSSEYSTILRKLTKKNWLIRGEGHGNYSLLPKLMDLYNAVNTQKQMSIFYVYEIADQGIGQYYDTEESLVQENSATA